MTITTKELKQYARDFIAWSESEFGFYVPTRWDRQRGLWVTHNGPVEWQPFERQYLRWALSLDEHGRMRVHTLAIIDIGQSGKTLKAAAIAQWMGMFIDVPGPNNEEPTILMAANAMHQADVRCFAKMRRSLLMNPHLNNIAEVQRFSVRFIHSGHIAMPVPMKASTQAGATASLIAFDEMWAYEGNRAREMFEEMKRTPARNVSLRLITTYPGYENDDGPLNDILNEFFDAFGAVRPGVERPLGKELPFYVRDGTALWWNHDPLYPWHTEEFMATAQKDYQARPEAFRRIWRAEIARREDGFVSQKEWSLCEDASLEPLTGYSPKTTMVLGVDLAAKRDSVAIVGRRYNWNTQTYDLVTHRIINPTGATGDILLEAERFILHLHERHKVLAVYIDPSMAYQMIANLNAARMHVVEVNQGRMREIADTQYRNLILGRKLRNYYQAADLRDHVLAAVAHYTNHETVRIRKPTDKARIDGAVADSMCCYGVTEYRDKFPKPGYSAIRPKQRRNVYREVFWGQTPVG